MPVSGNHKTMNKLPPRWIINLIRLLRTGLVMLNKKLFPGKVVLYEQFQWLFLLPCLHLVAELNIAERLRKGPLHVSELAAASGIREEELYRVMRALASEGIFREKKEKYFLLNAASKALLDEPGSLRYMILHHLGHENWHMLGDLNETVKSGKDGFSRIYGKNIYQYLNEHPDRFRVFDRSMTGLTLMGLDPIMQAFSFRGIQTIADIGGGEGLLLANILRAYPAKKGILFDLPEAVKGADSMFRTYSIGERVSIVTGDFLESVPGNADGYLLKNILHNWDDETCIRILSNIRNAMPDKGTVILIDMIIPGINKPSAGKLLDIQMMATLPGGKERTLREFEYLLKQSRLTIRKVHYTIAPIAVIEARRNY
jgi:hypothetical protein